MQTAFPQHPFTPTMPTHKKAAVPMIKRIAITPGVTLELIDEFMPETVSLPIMTTPNIIEFAFVISGEAEAAICTGKDRGTLHISPDSRMAVLVEGYGKTFTIQGKSDIKMIGIKVDLSFLKAITGTESVFNNQDKLPLNERKSLSGWDRTITNQIFGSWQGNSCSAAKTLFLQSKTLDLLARQIAELEEHYHGQLPVFSLTPHEVQKIHNARVILESNMSKPPSLKELARLVGIGINKMKYGFKTVHGQTPYLCLHEARMSKAHALLSQKEMNVSQVAWEVGYTNVGHFSAAFYKQFDVKPKAFQKGQKTQSMNF